MCTWLFWGGGPASHREVTEFEQGRALRPKVGHRARSGRRQLREDRARMVPDRSIQCRAFTFGSAIALEKHQEEHARIVEPGRNGHGIMLMENIRGW